MRQNKRLDFLKFASSLLIVGSHCLPIINNEMINFFYGQWFFRFCVPLFVISSGYYFATFDMKGKIDYIKRIWFLYGLSSLLYIPIYFGSGIKTIIKNLLFGYHHLWYLSALAISLLAYYLLEKTILIKLVGKYKLPIGVILLVIGAYFDEYINIFSSTFTRELGEIVGYIGGSRHAIFFVFPLLLIGHYIYVQKEKLFNITSKTRKILLVGSSVLSLIEVIVLRIILGTDITCDVTLFNFWPAIFLFVLTFSKKQFFGKIKSTKQLRKCADIIYIVHVWVIIFVDKLFDVEHLLRVLIVLIVSILIAVVYYIVLKNTKSYIKCSV